MTVVPFGTSICLPSMVARTWPGVNSVGLSVSENSGAARRLYERLGFIAWGREPDCLHLPDGRAFAEIHMYRPL